MLVSHRFSTVRMADLIVVLDGGRVVEVGSHAELMAAGGLYAELYELQARAYRSVDENAPPTRALQRWRALASTFRWVDVRPRGA